MNSNEFSIFNHFIKSFAAKKTLSSILNLYLVGPCLQNNQIKQDPRLHAAPNIQIFLQQLKNELRSNQALSMLMPIIDTVEVLEFSQHIIKQYEDNTEIGISYSNIYDLFPNITPNITMYLNSIRSEQLIDLDFIEFEIAAINKTIYVYEGLKGAKASLAKLSEVFSGNNMSENESPMNVFSAFKDAIISNYTELSSIMDNHGDVDESTTFSFSDTSSIFSVVDSMFEFIAKDYSFYITNYAIIDDCMPLESAVTSIITGPSNHCKSIFMVNICKRIIQFNAESFNRYDIEEKKSDVVLFITLEDDIYKLTRRMMSIFGNHSPNEVKDIVRLCNKVAVNEQNKYNHISEDTELLIKNIINELLTNSIVSITTGSAELVIQHGTENTFCCTDINKKITNLEKDNKIVKALFVDYVDVMVPNDHLINYIADDYKSQGQILHELRLVGRAHMIPVMTVTQNNKLTEDVTVELSNSLIGDSYKKVRYSDNIMMIRQRPDISIEDDAMLNDMKNMDHINRDESEQRDLVFLKSSLVPLECKVTKSKDNERDKKLMYIFSKTNLCIYSDWKELKLDWNAQNNKSSFYLNVKDELNKHISPEISTQSLNIPVGFTNTNVVDSDEEAFLYTY